MAEPLTVPRTTSHRRSISLPSTHYPLNSSIEDILLKLRNSEPSLSASFICQNLHDIKELYVEINSSIQCPLNQQVLCLEQNRTRIEEVLEGSLSLLDACSSITDVLASMKESFLEIESALRRKGGAEEQDLYSYITSRKKIHRMAKSCMKKLQTNYKLEKDCTSITPAVRMLREAEAASLSKFKSVLAFLLETDGRKRWTLVAKLVQKHMHSCERQDGNEVQKIDAALSALAAKKSSINITMTQDLLRQLETLEVAIQEMEECLGSISRCLLKTRVSLLNILSL